ncbi:hypothetical protein [Wenyingzhuangia sp. IMCC45467]
MKKIILFISCVTTMLLTSCNFEKKFDFKETTYTKTELFGKWFLHESEKTPDKIIINKILLNEDMTAEIEVIESSEYKTVNGKWSIYDKTKVGSENFNITFNSDVKLTFILNQKLTQIIMLDVKELNNEKVLKYNNQYYIKK